MTNFIAPLVKSFQRRPGATPAKVRSGTPETIEHELFTMLTYRRKAGGDGEKQFINRFIKTIPGISNDAYGNFYLVVGDRLPVVMFSCHLDTVHNEDGRQSVAYDSNLDEIFLTDPRSSCLGADDAGGIYILRRLIQANVPGLYVFHRDEESGGQGSTFFAKTHTELLASVNACVAFDRKGTTDIITAQSGGTCCSDKFARALAAELDMNHTPSANGLFTDSANYTHLISECTNIAIGYEGAHSAKETIGLKYIDELAAACIKVKWNELPFVRDPSADDDFGYYGSRRSSPWIDDWSAPIRDPGTRGVTGRTLSYEELETIAYEDPCLAALMLYNLNATDDDIEQAM